MKVKDYYNKIANDYDDSRFDNTYGRYIDSQERALISSVLKSQKMVLNLGCGTGRFMEYCSHGSDFSEEMLEIAKRKHPNKSFALADAASTPFSTNFFDAVICFHVIMHLTPEQSKLIFDEVSRILKPDGLFIVDFPSKARRKLTKGHHSKNWHGSNAFNLSEIKELLNNSNLKTTKQRGILFFPIHRFPKSFRRLFYIFDQFFCSIFTKKYASYILNMSRNCK